MNSASSVDEGELDHIVGGADSDELEAMNLSSQQPDCLQELLGVIPAPTKDAVSTTGLAPHEGRTGELQGGGPCQGPSHSLSNATKHNPKIHADEERSTQASNVQACRELRK